MSSSSATAGLPSSALPTMQEKLVEMAAGKTVMISGCGGGCDCYGGMIIAHQIQAVAKKVIFGNLSFISEYALSAEGTKITDDCFRMDPIVGGDTKIQEKCQKYGHFAEALMATYVGQPVYAFRHRASVGGLMKSYQAILEHEGLLSSNNHSKKSKGWEDMLNNLEDEKEREEVEAASITSALDVLILMDGGCDALLTGNEDGGLATPVEDMMHIKAVQLMDRALINPRGKYVAAIGANVDLAHGVFQESLDKRLKELIEVHQAATFQPHVFKKDHPAAQYFINGVSVCNPVRTIVQSLAVAAIEGHRGFYTPPHLVPRIGKTTVELTDQTATLFCFDFNTIASQVAYLDGFNEKTTQTVATVVINQFLDKKERIEQEDAKKKAAKERDFI